MRNATYILPRRKEKREEMGKGKERYTRDWTVPHEVREAMAAKPRGSKQLTSCCDMISLSPHSN